MSKLKIAIHKCKFHAFHIFKYYLLKIFKHCLLNSHIKIDVKEFVFPYFLFISFTLNVTHKIGFLT